MGLPKKQMGLPNVYQKSNVNKKVDGQTKKVDRSTKQMSLPKKQMCLLKKGDGFTKKVMSTKKVDSWT